MKSVHKIKVQISRDITLVFCATKIVDERSKKAYVRSSSLGIVDPDSGSVVIDLDARIVVLMYDGITITSGIFFYKEAEGSYHYRCVCDLFLFDLYVLKDGVEDSVFRLVD